MQIVDGLLLPSTFDEALELSYGSKANFDTDIYGLGWGSVHRWQKMGNRVYVGLDGRERAEVGGPTYYRCKRCGVLFWHYYHDIPNIFEAMKLFGVSDVC